MSEAGLSPGDLCWLRRHAEPSELVLFLEVLPRPFEFHLERVAVLKPDGTRARVPRFTLVRAQEAIQGEGEGGGAAAEKKKTPGPST